MKKLILLLLFIPLFFSCDLTKKESLQNCQGDNIKLDPVMLDKSTTTEDLLQFYMGKNTQDRQKFIIDNLKVELDVAEEIV